MRTVSFLLALYPLATACIFVRAEDDAAHDQAHHAVADEHAAHGAVARATIEARSSSTVAGTATFTEVPGGVLVEVEIHGAPPGWHAAHIHENGDCSAPDAASAGGHFNPAGKPHGAPHAMERHAGDLGNLWVDEKGDGHHVLLMPDLTVADGTFSVRNRAIVIHEKADDLTTQPTGNAGGRIGCGVIR